MFTIDEESGSGGDKSKSDESKKKFPKTPVRLNSISDLKTESSEPLNVNLEFGFVHFAFDRRVPALNHSGIKKNDRVIVSQLMTEIESNGYLTMMQNGLIYALLVLLMVSVMFYWILYVPIGCLVVLILVFLTKN
jgi:hypothetical protein